MAFLYEKVSKEEVKKFNLDELWNHYHEEAYIRLPEEWFEHYWTVDREREIWLYDMNHVQQNWDGELYLLHYKSRNIEMVVQSDSNNSSSLNDVPFIKNIDFVSANSIFIDEFNLEELKTILKESLVCFLTEKFFRLRPNDANYILNCRW
jgi:hypothetical protein